MKAKIKQYGSSEEFGAGLGLSDLEMKFIQQKKSLIAKIKAVRLKRHLSQAALAKLMGTKQPAIARMEAGQVGQVSMDFLLRIAFVLEMPISIKPTKLAA